MSSLALRFCDLVLPLAMERPASPLPDQPIGGERGQRQREQDGGCE
jgi:hypothetical protein